ncbi:MAG: cache domain-containing protein [Verrucomicrobia bacterium]|nr:cache domain-containing protein [Verrucomicrobiota bacterium]
MSTVSQPNEPKAEGAAGGFSLAALRRVRVTIATKLIVGFLLVCLIVGVTFGVIGVHIIGGLVVDEAQEKVRTDLNVAREIYLNHLDRISDKVRFVAGRTFVRDGSSFKERDKVVESLTAFRERERLDVLGVTDSKGIVMVRVTNPGVFGDDQGQDPLVARVLQSREPVASTCLMTGDQLRKESPALAERARFEVVSTPKTQSRAEREETSGLMLKAAAPVFDLKNQFIGVAYGGILLNRNFEIVDKIKQTVFQDVKYQGEEIGSATIFQDDLRISTNVQNENGARAIGTRAAKDVYDRVVTQGERWIGRAYVVNAWYITAYEPIRDVLNKIVGMLYVGVREQKYTDTRMRATAAFVAITLAGGAASMCLFYFIARNISVLVHKLVLASREVARGNLDARVEIASQDELHELADTFNSMASSLKKRDEKLREFARKKIMQSERLAVIGQLAAGVAHEMNNPLTGIVTYSHLLLERANAQDGTSEFLRKIATQADRCRVIVRGLLDFSRPKKPDKRSCNLNQVLQECVSLVENQSLFHNIQVEKNFQKNLPLVIVDPSLIQQVFMNLIINAAEAMDGKGRLSLATRLEPDGECVEIVFADSGHGISEENLERIFDPFFTTKEVGHGTGLGLAISFGIVKEHEGTIAVESEMGKGSTFTVRLPARDLNKA